MDSYFCVYVKNFLSVNDVLASFSNDNTPGSCLDSPSSGSSECTEGSLDNQVIV